MAVRSLFQIQDSRFQLHSRGFTLIELLIAITLFVIVTTMAVLSLNRLERTSNLDGAAGQTIALLRDAQNRSLAVQENRQWAVHVSSSTVPQFVALFRATSAGVDPSWATDSATAVERVVMGRGFSLTNLSVELPDGGTCTADCDIIFDFSGKLKSYGTAPSFVAFTITLVGGGTKQIIVTNNGRIEAL